MKRREAIGKIIQDGQTNGNDWVYIHNGNFDAVRDEFYRLKEELRKKGQILWHSGHSFYGDNEVTKIWGESGKNEWGLISL